ncbi:Shikimate kinase 1- chloroplastic [Striga hermonthica]|uniref:Shikimate kinase 1- chloroplastic n=1 Tax=Striga hermonthica TaxID=68872 RepID=A0A9N7R070_STRHE|nr:Shikimate kinase 1- chloroplastic [Striga hermonthica]
MEAGVFSMGLQLGPCINPEKFARKPNNSLHFFQKYGEQPVCWAPAKCHQLARSFRFYGPKVLRVSSSENGSASVLEATEVPDELKIMKKKSEEEIKPYLHGRCIYLVGMMGSGKTTVGKVLAEALRYTFFDCDKMVEQAAGGKTVSEIFKSHGEKFFRDNEHMRKGVTVWLDVPLEALAHRITAIGTNSRPLLHHESGDPYSKTMKRLSALYEERGEAYANADVQVSLQNLAAKLGFEDVCSLTPTAIAFEALLQLESFLKK